MNLRFCTAADTRPSFSIQYVWAVSVISYQLKFWHLHMNICVACCTDIRRPSRVPNGGSVGRGIPGGGHRPLWRVTNQLCSLGFISQDKNRGRETIDEAAEIIDFLVVYWCTHLSTKMFIQSVTSTKSVAEYWIFICGSVCIVYSAWCIMSCHAFVYCTRRHVYI